MNCGSGEKNRKITADITAVVEKHLGVPSDRFYIKVSGIKFGGSEIHLQVVISNFRPM